MDITCGVMSIYKKEEEEKEKKNAFNPKLEALTDMLQI